MYMWFCSCDRAMSGESHLRRWDHVLVWFYISSCIGQNKFTQVLQCLSVLSLRLQKGPLKGMWKRLCKAQGHVLMIGGKPCYWLILWYMTMPIVQSESRIVGWKGESRSSHALQTATGVLSAIKKVSCIFVLKCHNGTHYTRVVWGFLWYYC